MCRLCRTSQETLWETTSLLRRNALNYVEIDCQGPGGRLDTNGHVSQHEQQLHLDSRLTFQTSCDACVSVRAGAGCHMTEHAPPPPEEKMFRYGCPRVP